MDEQQHRQQARAERDNMYCYLCDYEMNGPRVLVAQNVTIDGLERTLLAHPTCVDEFYGWQIKNQVLLLTQYREKRLNRP